MSHDALRLAILLGSTRAGRFGPVIGDWVADHAKQRDDLDIDVVDLDTVDLPARFPSDVTEHAPGYLERLDDADAFVMVTPEYNHSFPASLKQGIDVAHAEWQAKPVGFVSYGGISGGLRAVEALRLVMAELHAVGIRDTVSFQHPRRLFDEHGELREAADAEAALDVMLDRLTWWGWTLREGRRAQPYAA